MKTLHDLNSAASDYENCIMLDLEALKRYRYKMCKEKDASKIKNIYGILKDLEHDTARYKEWAGQEIEAIEKQQEKHTRDMGKGWTG